MRRLVSGVREERIDRLSIDRDKVLEEALASYSRLLWVVASRHLSRADGFSEQDIEECVADVFFDLWQDFDRYDPEKGSLKSYLCAVTSHKAISRYRKATQMKVISLDDVQQFEEPSYEEVVEPDDYRDLYDAISDLPEPTREILMRRYFFEEQPSTIATRMHLPKKEVENRLYRAKVSLSRTLPAKYKEALS